MSDITEDDISDTVSKKRPGYNGAKGMVVREALVIGACRRCGRRDRMLSREGRVCVREEYDKDVLAFVAKADPTCKEKRA